MAGSTNPVEVGYWPFSLDNAAYWVDRIRDQIDVWDDGTKDHYVGATILHPYLTYLSVDFRSLYWNVLEASEEGWLTTDYLERLDSGEYWLDLLESYGGYLWGLYDNPGDTLSGLLGGTFPDWPYFTMDPAYMVEWWLDDYLGWFTDWTVDPAGVTVQWLDGVIPDFAYWRTDPAYMTLWHMEQSDRFFEGLSDDPSGWFTAKVEAVQYQEYDPPSEPWQWAIETILSYLEQGNDWILQRLQAVAVRFVRYMIEGVF